MGRRRQLADVAIGALIFTNLVAPLFLFASSASAATTSRVVSAHHKTHPAVTAPDPVRSLHVRWQDRHDGLGTALVIWAPPLNNGGSDITSYVVTENEKTCTPAAVTNTRMACQIPSLDAGTPYQFTVTDQNAIGTSTKSVTSTLGAEGQTITFNALADTTFDKSPLTLNASSTSGLAISYHADGACSVSGDVLTLTAVGSCAVTANQAGSSKFQPASPVANFFEVGPGSATITMTHQVFSDDGKAHVASFSVTPYISGVALTYCLNSGFGPKVCSATAPREPGVYHVTAKLDNLNYVAKPVTALETVNPPKAILPDNLLDTASATPSGTTHFTKSGVKVETTGSGFTPGHSIDVGAISAESLGSFKVPSTTSEASWLDLFRSSSDATAVLSVRKVHATTADALSVMGTLAYPDGSFPGAGSYELVEIQSSGFIPHTTVSAVLHSNPAVLAQSTANANGIVTLVVPLAYAFAGEQHELFLSGTYLVTTTNAGAGGAANATFNFSNSLLSRLVPSASVVMVFRDALDPFVTVSNSVSLPSRAAYETYVKQHTPLNLARYKPVKHVGNTLKGVTGAAAALSAVAAGVAVARAAGAATGASVASHASAIGTRGASAAHRGSTETIDAVHHLHDASREHIGDHSFTWRFPGRQIVDDLSLVAPVKFSKYSPLAAISIADAGYWRAMFGSLSLALPVGGAVLGTLSALQTHGWPLPPHLNLFVAIVVLGFFDATAGFAAAMASLVGAIGTGRIFSLNMVISELLLATLWFGLPIMVKKIRPFIRPHPQSFQDWWVRVADLFVGPAFAGFLAAKLVDSFSLISNLKVGLVAHGNLVGYIVAGVCVLRYLVATFAVFFYPKRLGEVTPTHLPEQTIHAFGVSLIMRMAFATLILAALLGRTWFVPALVGLLGFGMYVRGRNLHLEIPTWCYRLIPRNMGKILAFEIVGTVVTGVVSQYVASPYWQIATLLFAIFLLGLVVDLLSGTRGKELPINWLTRLAGVALFIITVLQLTDNLVT